MKYIIEFEDMPSLAEDGIAYYKCKQAPWWFVGDSLIGKLTSAQNILSEIDKIDQKVDEAYQKGINDGSLDAKQRVEGAYQKGLTDAWEAARKIAQQWEEDTDTEHRIVIDDSVSITLNSMTASEAIAKLKSYEEKQKADDKIKVGDEVDCSGDSFIVTRIFHAITGKVECDGVDMDGCTYHDVLISGLTKTGRHVDIDKILGELRE